MKRTKGLLNNQFHNIAAVKYIFLFNYWGNCINMIMTVTQIGIGI